MNVSEHNKRKIKFALTQTIKYTHTLEFGQVHGKPAVFIQPRNRSYLAILNKSEHKLKFYKIKFDQGMLKAIGYTRVGQSGQIPPFNFNGTNSRNNKTGTNSRSNLKSHIPFGINIGYQPPPPPLRPVTAR